MRLESEGHNCALKEKVALIMNSASYDRVAYGLAIAVALATLGNEVHILFTYGAVTRLVKGRTDRVEEETDAWIRQGVKVGLVAGSIQKISDLLKDLRKFGGKIYACVSAMAFHDIRKDELIDEVDHVTGITAFLGMTKGATTVLYI